MLSALQATNFKIKSTIFDTVDHMERGRSHPGLYDFEFGVGIFPPTLDDYSLNWKVGLNVIAKPKRGKNKKYAHYRKVMVVAAQSYFVPLSVLDDFDESTVNNSIGMLYTSIKAYVATTTSCFWVGAFTMPSVNVSELAGVADGIPEFLEAVLEKMREYVHKPDLPELPDPEPERSELKPEP